MNAFYYSILELLYFILIFSYFDLVSLFFSLYFLDDEEVHDYIHIT